MSKYRASVIGLRWMGDAMLKEYFKGVYPTLITPMGMIGTLTIMPSLDLDNTKIDLSILEG